ARFVDAILDPVRSSRFLDDFTTFQLRVAYFGALNSLAQTLVKITAPGVPDFYQGTELWDLSLVDPDNRRSVDFAARHAALPAFDENPDWAALGTDWPSGRIKLPLSRQLLAIRKRFDAVFTGGDYQPLAAIGPNADEIVAFKR